MAGFLRRRPCSGLIFVEHKNELHTIHRNNRKINQGLGKNKLSDKARAGRKGMGRLFIMV
jgi:hypothetical protein